MKTLKEFIQRLQNDPGFEKRAQAFDHGEDLIDFVKSQGYDFTLEQLMSEFARGKKLTTENSGLAPAEVNPSHPLRPDEEEFPQQPKVFSRGESATALPKKEDDDVTREQPLERLAPSNAPMPPPHPEEELRAGLFRCGGGRHRGFSPQRLKSTPEEDS